MVRTHSTGWFPTLFRSHLIIQVYRVSTSLANHEAALVVDMGRGWTQVTPWGWVHTRVGASWVCLRRVHRRKESLYLLFILLRKKHVCNHLFNSQPLNQRSTICQQLFL